MLTGFQIEKAAVALRDVVELLRKVDTEAQIRIIVSCAIFLHVRDEVAERLRGARG